MHTYKHVLQKKKRKAGLQDLIETESMAKCGKKQRNCQNVDVTSGIYQPLNVIIKHRIQKNKTENGWISWGPNEVSPFLILCCMVKLCLCPLRWGEKKEEVEKRQEQDEKQSPSKQL